MTTVNQMSSESLTLQCKCSALYPSYIITQTYSNARQISSHRLHSTLYWIKYVPGRRQIKSGFESSGSVSRRCRILLQRFFERAARWSQTRVIEDA